MHLELFCFQARRSLFHLYLSTLQDSLHNTHSFQYLDISLLTDPHTAIFPTQHHSGVYGQLRTCHLLKDELQKNFILFVLAKALRVIPA